MLVENDKLSCLANVRCEGVYSSAISSFKFCAKKKNDLLEEWGQVKNE